jgi:hypothetical protein
MLKTFQDILTKYFKRNKEVLFSNNILYEMNGAVLYKTNNAIFNFYGTMIDEVIAYCKEQGYRPDKIVFVASYDIEVEDAEQMRAKMEADSKISIVEEGGLKIARICMGESIIIKKKTVR